MTKKRTERHRLHAYLSGRVQGVGMRATVAHLARKHGIAGWVRNLPDGRVELDAEGTTEDLKDLLAELRADMGVFIRGVEEVWGEPTASHESFRVLF